MNDTDWRDFWIAFTYHLEEQIINLAKQIRDLITPQDEVVLNVFGFSRGGVGAFLLCKKLKDIGNLKINVAALDPVPGNFISSVFADIWFGINNTLTAQVANLDDCHNIASLHVLFTNKPMPDIEVHAPILPHYLKPCEDAEVDVTPGCHMSAQAFDKCDNYIRANNIESAIVFHRIVDYLEKHNTIFDFSKYEFSNKLNLHQQSRDEKQMELYKRYALLNRYQQPMSRSMQLNNQIYTNPHGNFVNEHHKKLCQAAGNESTLFSIKETNPNLFWMKSANTGISQKDSLNYKKIVL